MAKNGTFARTSAKADTLLFGLLALPYVSTYALGLLFQLGATVGDARSIPDLSDPFLKLAICLIGVFGLFTVWVRFTDKGPASFKAIGALKLCAAILFGFAIIQGAPLVLLIFMTVDLITGCRLFFNPTK